MYTLDKNQSCLSCLLEEPVIVKIIRLIDRLVYFIYRPSFLFCLHQQWGIETNMSIYTTELLWWYNSAKLLEADWFFLIAWKEAILKLSSYCCPAIYGQA